MKIVRLSWGFFPRFLPNGELRGFWATTRDGVPQEPSFLNDFDNWFEWCRWKHTYSHESRLARLDKAIQELQSVTT